jgi:exonuclease III
MTLLFWNIQHGGGARIPRIVEEITAYDPDVIGLTAYRLKSGEVLAKSLREGGWIYRETTAEPPNQNGVAVFSRTPVLRVRPSSAPLGEEVRWLDIELPDFGFGIGLLHIMAAGGSRKSPKTIAKLAMWDAIVAAAEARRSQPFLFAGAWNTGTHRLDEPGSSFVGDGHFAKLTELGWTDLWRHDHPGSTEFTWYWKARGVRGKGYRIDHAFASPSLLPRVRSCRYSHAEREAGISNHSLVIVEVE